MIPNMYKIAGELLPCVRSPNMRQRRLVELPEFGGV